MAYKYPKTWAAIDDALEKSKNLKQYPTIEALVKYMREYPHNADGLDFNLVVCAGNEMDDDPKSPIWNRVIEIWIAERKEVANAESKSNPKVARVT